MSFFRKICVIIFNRIGRKLLLPFKFPALYIIRKYQLLKITFLSLFYNEQADFNYCVDTLLEPIYWFVDNYTKALGPFFVFVVVSLLSSFVVIAYLIGLPFWLERSPTITAIALVLGNYILINVVFHYYMALKTSPGYPPQDRILFDVVSICKKCFIPKPPRAHHCSVCNRCILKMDHHCPWLDNCIGHYNHRFFFQFCAYTWIGTIFIIIFGVSIAYEQFILDVNTSNGSISTNYELWSLVGDYLSRWRKNLIIYELLLCLGTFISVGLLGLWHIKLITKGETCVETFINKKRMKKLLENGHNYCNPFDKGSKLNWVIFLGLDQPNMKWRHILLPSTHLPKSTGLFWDISRKVP
ncbi:palmitoyltransferase ZDHHC16 isoform X2 [Brevipalpus obovatus]|uniref:palmitoyltransferase ZDHHC16 isoform X2 n=1 Tax=Brevipalpus obovatus TaxID=246614 RepID=UPI003D9EA61B